MSKNRMQPKCRGLSVPRENSLWTDRDSKIWLIVDSNPSMALMRPRDEEGIALVRITDFEKFYTEYRYAGKFVPDGN